MNCHNCNKVLFSKFFSEFIFHYINIPDEEMLPIFCNEECMLQYIKKRTGKDVRKDWQEYNRFVRKETL